MSASVSFGPAVSPSAPSSHRRWRPSPSPRWRGRWPGPRLSMRIVGVEVGEDAGQPRIAARRPAAGDQEAASTGPRRISGAVAPDRDRLHLAADPSPAAPGSASRSRCRRASSAPLSSTSCASKWRALAVGRGDGRGDPRLALQRQRRGPRPARGAGRRCRRASARRRAGRSRGWRSSRAGPRSCGSPTGGETESPSMPPRQMITTSLRVASVAVGGGEGLAAEELDGERRGPGRRPAPGGGTGRRRRDRCGHRRWNSGAHQQDGRGPRRGSRRGRWRWRRAGVRRAPSASSASCDRVAPVQRPGRRRLSAQAMRLITRVGRAPGLGAPPASPWARGR